MYHSRWKGSHYDAGFRFGSLLYKNRVQLEQVIQVPPEKMEFAIRCIPFYQREFPEVLQEIKGLADGQRISYERLAAFLLSMYCFTPDIHCSCFAFCDQETILLGRNSDFLISIEKLCDSPFYHLDDAYSFVGNTTAEIEMEDGVNEHGLAIGLTFIYPLKIKPGLNAGMLVRYILEKCRTTREALDVLQRLPIASAQTLTIIDQSGDMALVECNCEKVTILRPGGEDPFIFTTNHFVSGEMIQYQYTGVDDIHSHDRYQTLSNAFAAHPHYSLDFARDLLSGKFGFMCQYDRSQGMDTIWSSVFDLKNKKIFRVEGNPSRKKFKEDTRLRFTS